jgi:glutaredoxin
MAKTIEVYITNKEVITATSLEGRPLAAAGEVHYCSMKEISKTEKVISEEDVAALKLVKELAAEQNLKFRIIDVASSKGKLKARLKGVRTTPTIIVGNKRLIGTPKREVFETLLEQ